MEHLGDPEAALEIVAGLASPWAIVSVPREPLWRVLNLGRLKYVGELGNTPGHLHHWSRGLVRALPRAAPRGRRGPQPDCRGRWRYAEREWARERAPACSRSSRSGSRGAWSCTRWAGRSCPTTPRSGRSPPDAPRSTAGNGRRRTRPGSDGHFYSVKAPGLAALTLPAYLALDASGAKSVARDAAANAAQADHPRWTPHRHPGPRASTGSAPRARHRVEVRIENETADRLGADPDRRGAPRDRAPAAGPLGRGADRAGLRDRGRDHARAGDDRDDLRRRVLLPRRRRRRSGSGRSRCCFASARARRGPAWSAPPGCSPAWRSASSTRSGSWARSCSVYAAGAPAPAAPGGGLRGGGRWSGAAPALAFNLWALGSPLRFAYSHAVAVQGLNRPRGAGAQLRAASSGSTSRSPGAAIDLLVASRGLLTLTPGARRWRSSGWCCCARGRARRGQR